ncbi:MAG: YerC/YecD family TrpR-related protein [Oscillospiraceae bacterium]|nr:YerC/YecD family TrpR-related protein [Oscillospiraceae bacterium]
MAQEKERRTALYEMVMKLKSPEACRRFFEDLCTPVELRAMEQRFEVAVCLHQGMVYLDILEKTGVSSATVSRVRRSTLDGGAGGVMREVLQRELPVEEKAGGVSER